MVKRLKYANPLPHFILGGLKNTTWRINDDKDINARDEISLCYMDNSEFARAKVISVKNTTFGELTSEDKKGHEEFETDAEMYITYSKFYKMQVTEDTPVKIIKFRVIKPSK